MFLPSLVNQGPSCSLWQRPAWWGLHGHTSLSLPHTRLGASRPLFTWALEKPTLLMAAGPAPTWIWWKLSILFLNSPHNMHYFIVCFYPPLKVDKMKTMISLSFKLEKPPPPGSLPSLLWSGLRYWVICTLLLMSFFLHDVDFHSLPKKITQVIHRPTQEYKHGEMTAIHQLLVWAWCSLQILGLTGTSYCPLR